MAATRGPRREPQRRSADALVVLLHGYGASGDDLIGLADAWSAVLPRAAFVAPHAPERLPHPDLGGYQWFDLTLRDPAELVVGTAKATPGLQAIVDAEMARYQLPPHRLALVGFSQGAMMALHIGLRRAVAPAAIVGYSGVIGGPERLVGEIRCRPPTLLVHGSEDEVIPVEAMHLTRHAIAACGVPVEWHEREELGHGIDPQGLRLAGAFLAEHLGR